MFPLSGPLEFFAINILGPLTKTKQENKFTIVTTDRYTKLTRARPVPKTATPNVAMVAFQN